MTEAQIRELKKVNDEGIVRVWKTDKVLKIYRALEVKNLIQIAWSTSCSIDYKRPGKNTTGMFG